MDSFISIFGRIIGFRDVLFYGTDHGHVGLLAAFFEHGVWILLLIGGFMFSYGYLGPDEAEYMMQPGCYCGINSSYFDVDFIQLSWDTSSNKFVISPIEAIGMMPSVISYVRLFAVGVVGVKIAETGNIKLL